MRFIYDISIRSKILLLSALLLLILQAVTAFGIVNNLRTGWQMDEVTHRNIPLMQLLAKITIEQSQKTILIEQAMRAVDAVDSTAALVLLQKKLARAEQQIIGYIEQASKLINGQVERGTGENEKGFLDSLSKAWQGTDINQSPQNAMKELLANIDRNHLQYQSSIRLILEKLQQWDAFSAGEILQQSEKTQTALSRDLSLLSAQAEAMSEASVVKMNQDKQFAIMSMLLVSTGAIVVGFLISLLIAKVITKPLIFSVKTANSLAEGDFSQQIPLGAKDESGQLLNAMQNLTTKLKAALSSVADSSQQVTSSSTGLIRITQQTSSGMGQQKQALKKTTSAIGTMEKRVQEVSENANQAAQSAELARGQSTTGVKRVQETKAAIDQLAQLMQQTGDTVKGISKNLAISAIIPI